MTSLTPGTKFAACTLVAVQPMDNGAIPVVMAGTNGARFNIDVMRFDADIHGVARAGSMAVYLSNLGDGSTATDEEHGLAAMALASELARREVAGEKVPTMKTISDRGARAEAPRLIS